MTEQLGDDCDRIELPLQKLEEKFTKLFQSSPDQILLVTIPEGWILECNDRCVDFFGYSHQELIGSTVAKIIFLNNLEADRRFRQLLQNQRSISNMEVNICLKDGKNKTVLISAEILDFNGQKSAIANIFDISDRTPAKLTLQESKQNLEAKAIFDAAPLAIFIKDLEGFYTQVNPAYEYINNLKWEKIIGKNDYELLPDDLAKISWSKDQLIIKQKQYIQSEEYVLGYDKKRHLLATKFPLLDLAGNSYAICGIAVDISDRKEAEELLRQSEERFRQLFENSPVAYYSLDEQGRYIDVNSELCDLLGYSREEIIGKSFSDFWSAETQDFFLKQFACFKSDGITREELQLVRKDADPITVLLEGRIQHDINGEFVKTHCILYNITDRKRIEEALRQTKAKLEQANCELTKLVTIDPLTQVANRRQFDSHLQQEWQRLGREQKPLSLVMFDVDYFKRYNDRYGHPQGDTCLVKIAQAAQQVLHRPWDLVARYGGEEFMVILPNTSPEGAIVVADRIRIAIHSLAIPHADSDVNDKVTVSLGIASVIPTAEELPEQLVAQADRALYIAKQQGRDRLAVNYD